MGILMYGNSDIRVNFSDRFLAHLQAVIGLKLRHNEAFFLSWADHSKAGGARSSLWVERSVPLLFRYADPAPILLNQEWLDVLTLSAATTAGLMCSPEPGKPQEHPASSSPDPTRRHKLNPPEPHN